MASRRPGLHVFAWSGSTAPRDQGAAADTPKEEAKFNARWNPARGTEGSHRQPARAIPQPTPSSRMPQALSHRRPSDSKTEQPRLSHQPRVRSSVGSAGSLVVGGADRPPSPASSSSRLAAPSLRPRNVLRRKRSGLSQDAGSMCNDARNESASSDSYPRSQTPLDALDLDRDLTQSPMEIRVAQQVKIPRTTAYAVTIYPELDRYRNVKPPARTESPGSNVPYRIATDLPPPTPLFSGTSSQLSGFSGSPSTGWSESPGPGPYSRDTTPTSMSSQSPGLVAPIRIPPPGARARQADPGQTRPPVTRKRTGSISNEVATEHHGLAAVRELSTSSSNSTVLADGIKEEKQSKGPPQPPPRKSSHKARESGEEVVSASKPFRKPAQPQVASPPPGKATSYSRTLPVQATHATSAAKPTPPVRPSRDGTADLQAQLGRPVPVVHSNLSTASLSERRQSGLLDSGPATRPTLSSSLPDRPSYLSRRPPTREPTPAPKTDISGHVADESKRATGRAARTPSPSVSSTFKSRFPIFGRRTKTVPEPSQRDRQEKPAARKGPAAGTGHEGYGRLGAVRRRSSVTNSARVIPGTMSSQENLASSHSQDPFLMERMAPVIIAGGEVVENRNTSSELTRTESNQSSALRRPSIESRNGSQISLSSREASRRTLWPSPLPRGSTQTPSTRSRRPSESSDSEALTMEPTLTLRRSMRRLKVGEREPPSLPKPVIACEHVVSPSTASLDASVMSEDSTFDPSAEPAVGGREPTGAAVFSGRKKLVRRPRSPRKWNLFGRSQSQPPEKKDTTQNVAATIKVVQSKPLAFYTMMDSSEQEDPEPLDLDEVLREARAVAATPEQPSGQSLTEDAEVRRLSVTRDLTPSQTPGSGRDHQPSMGPKRAVPSPATLSPVPSAEPRPVPTPTQQPAPPRQTTSRPSRLPQVGRIPKVVSARADRISPKSFSRPFHTLSVQAPPVTADLQDMDSVAKGPSPSKISTPEPPYEGPMAPNASNISALIYGVPRLPPPVPSQPGHEFLSFSPRKDSQCTTTTSSSSSGRRLSYADATAVVPDPNAPLAEDEIWDEYNDLLGEDTIRLSTFAGPSLPGPLRVGGSAQGSGEWIEPALGSPTLGPPSLPSLVHALRSGMEHPSLSVRGSDIAVEVKRMLDGGLAPENATAVVNSLSGGNSQTQSLDVGTQTEELGSPAQRNSSSDAHQVRCSDASGSSQGSEDSSPLSQVNLRVGSMTVSKWLTFGHVLFSPVRDELVTVVGSLKRPSILVVDGLGNDDWSFYAAETYPAATFFNLSPRAPLPAERRTSESSFPLSPPNHHQVQYLSHTDKFPFGAQSFTAVVFRFPAAAPEGHYRNIISEARRVLKPGGYIELSILDVDLNNMGNRCRRTVRRLKERIHARAPNTSLASTSDLVLRLIGRRGFSDIKTCRVGVPVASTIARNNNNNNTSAAGSRMGGGAGGKNSSSAGGAVSTGERDGGGNKPFGRKKRDERSLPEMMDDASAVADESIAKSVAKIGRWWYSRCYESAAAAGSSCSMWRDRALLAECEEWGTSLKLMVCHARVPDGRGRVASI